MQLHLTNKKTTIMNRRDEAEIKNNTCLSFWFMKDDHTFIKLEGKNISEIKQNALDVAKRNPYGMVCPVKILQGEKELYSIGPSCHVDSRGNLDLEQWWIDVTKVDCLTIKLWNKEI
jgi:hypothetical protein